MWDWQHDGRDHDFYSQSLYGHGDGDEHLFYLRDSIVTLADRKIGGIQNYWNGIRRPEEGFAIETEETAAFAASDHEKERDALVAQMKDSAIPESVRKHVVQHGTFGHWLYLFYH